MTTSTKPGYADVFQMYTDLGWPGVIKLRTATKFPPPKGFTGADGAYPSYADMHAWAEDEPGGNTALRLPDGCIGIDEDRYNGKTGQQTIEEAERRWGALPASRKSSSRGDGSGIRIYRVPEGMKFVEKLKFPELGLGGVEIIQPHHRYVMCWPSVHDTTGQTYYWLDDDGTITTPPRAEEIPELPDKWVKGLQEVDKPRDTTGLGSDGPYNVRSALTEGEPSRRVAAKLGEAVVACQGGSRHDDIRDHVLGLLRCGKQGEPGVMAALTALQKVFLDAVAKDRAGGRDQATTEYRKFVFGDRVSQLLADTSYDFTDNIEEVGPEAFGAAAEEVDDGQPGADPLEGAVAYKMQALRIQREAQRRLDEEQNPPAELPPVKSLDALLAEPDQPSQYRIKDLAPLGGRVLLSAQYKAGKTTLVSNLLRSLADNTAFLSHFDITTPAERIALVDDELSENMLRMWLREQGIGNTAAVVDTVSLRGKLSAFNPMDDRNRTQWATRWRDLGVEYLVLDCLRPILDAHGLDENRDTGTFLVAFDALLEEAGIGDSLTLHHMGHANERARGDSRLQDWPDAIWRVMRETEEPDSDRYFSAFGRDVNITEGRLTYDPATRRLTYAGGNRTDARLDKARVDVIELLVAAAAKGAKPNGSAIEAALVPPHTQKSLRQAVGLLARQGLVTVEDGARNAKLHSIAHPCAECRLPVVTGRERHESCPQDVEELILE